MRGATGTVVSPTFNSINFNPRTPCEVRRAPLFHHRLKASISIHAPHARCDDNLRNSICQRRHLNPRTPCEVRRCERCFKSHGFYFNPRTPCEVRPYLQKIPAANSNFNPRTPCEVRQPTETRIYSTDKFQSTHPMRGATKFCRLNHM